VKAKIDFECIKRFVEQDKFIISNHARIRMFQRNVSTNKVKRIIMEGEIIEEYVEDEPCPSALILGFLDEIPYHVVAAKCEDHVRIVTIYKPEEGKWVRYKIRRR
jgi:hypothetical protein